MARGIEPFRQPPTTRERMIAGAVDLISRRGVHATSLRHVVQHTGTPRGSLVHHFPGGKQQMLEDALAFATETVARPLQSMVDEHGAIGGLHAFGAWWKRILQASGFEAGCPVLAVAIEPHDAQGLAEADAFAHDAALRALVTEAFLRWQSILARSLQHAGVDEGRSRRLAVMAVAAIEGTVAMCRAARASAPLDDVIDELDAVFRSAIHAP